MYYLFCYCEYVLFSNFISSLLETVASVPRPAALPSTRIALCLPSAAEGRGGAGCGMWVVPGVGGGWWPGFASLWMIPARNSEAPSCLNRGCLGLNVLRAEGDVLP